MASTNGPILQSTAEEANKMDLLKILAEVYKCASAKEIAFPNSYYEFDEATKNLMKAFKKSDNILYQEDFSSEAAVFKDIIGTMVFQDLEVGLKEHNCQITSPSIFEHVAKLVLTALPPPGPEGRILRSFNHIRKIRAIGNCGCNCEPVCIRCKLAKLQLVPKVILWKCKGRRSPSPPTYVSEFKFKSESKNIQHFKFKLMKEQLVHQTNSVTMANLIVALVDSECQYLQIKPNEVKIEDRDHCDTYPEGLIYFGVKHPTALQQQLDDESKKGWNSVNFMKQCRYGACQIVASAQNFFADNVKHSFNRGTKVYPCEYSQQIFVSNDMDILYTCNVDSNKVHNLSKIEDISNFEWELQYCEKGNWTHPEVVLLGGAKCKVGEFKVEFSDHHECVCGRSCCNCLKEVTLEKVQDSNENEEASPSKIQKTEDEKIMIRNTPSRNKSNVILIFALTVPTKCREKVVKLQEEHKVFNEEDFKVIQAWWDKKKETYIVEK